MTENELLLARIEDCIQSCQDNYLITSTNFLDIYQQSTVIEYLRKKNIRYELYGGFDDCERKTAVFFPDYADGVNYLTENPELSPIVSLDIKKDNFSTLSHRDYLGAVMGLGIKREMIGDIIVGTDGCSMAAVRSVASYIEQNLTSVGRGSVKVTVSDVFSDRSSEASFESKRCYVSSMRLDAVVSAAFLMSRNTASERIKHGDVIVNGVVAVKSDARVAFGSKIVIHGSGKVIIEEDAGMTKKGRQAFIIRKY